MPNSCPTRPPPVTSACHHLARVENAKNSPARNVHQVNHLQKQPITLGLQAQHASACLSETRRPALAALGLSRVPLTCTECRLRATALAAGERHSRKSGRRWDGEGSRGMAKASRRGLCDTAKRHRPRKPRHPRSPAPTSKAWLPHSGIQKGAAHYRGRRLLLMFDNRFAHAVRDAKQWRRGESNPGPVTHIQDFSGRSLLWIFSAPVLAQTRSLTGSVV